MFFKKLCTPANIYLTISMVILFVLIIQNFQIPNDKFCAGKLECQLNSTAMKFGLFVGQFIYIIFWTWILNLMCKDGYSTIAWLFVILPILAMFAMMAAIFTMFESEIKKII